MGLYYPNQTKFDVIGSETDAGVITRVALTDYYNYDGTTTKSFAVGGFPKLELNVSYLAGVGETSNSLQIAIDSSNDGVTWFRLVNDSVSDGTSTLTQRQFTIAQSTVEGYLAYDGQSANFTAGLKVTDGTSGATGYIESDTDGGTAGTLLLSNISGTFGNDNAITDSGTGAATINGVLQSLTNFSLPLDISSEHIRISVKETGVSANAGTIFVSGLLLGK